MQRGLAALAQLLPLALSPEKWSEPGADREALRWVAPLRASADDLDRHAREGDVSFGYLSRSLAREARELERDIGRRRYASASERTVRITETCVACHARLPAESQDRFSAALLARVDERRLAPLARAQLQTATRQFDAALASYESQFADPFSPGVLLEVSEALPSYFILALRVRRDPARAERGLDLLARRSDLTAQLRRDLDTWRAALRATAPALQQPPTLDAARRLLEGGLALRQFPWQESGMIHAIVASSVLYRYIDDRKPRGEDLAEALYLLARTEAFTLRSFELLEPQHYLEQAVRLAPHTDVAERAFAMLELEVSLSYGAAGEPIPGEVLGWLDELRRLSEIHPSESSAAI